MKMSEPVSPAGDAPGDGPGEERVAPWTGHSLGFTGSSDSSSARTSRSGSAGTDRSTGSRPKQSLDQPLRSAESIVQEIIRAEAG